MASTYEKPSSDDDTDPIYISAETDEDESFNATLNTTSNAELGVSPIKLHAVSSRAKVSLGKRKVSQI